MEKLIDPAVLTTIGGLSVILLLALLVKTITGLVTAFKGKKSGNRNGNRNGNGDLDLSKSPQFCVHADEQKRIYFLMKEAEKRDAEIKEALSKLVGFNERQANSLERLVQLRTEFVHKG